MLQGVKTFLQRLVYPSILNEIDQINKLSNIGLSIVEEEEQSEKIKIPRIIVIGDENAGKSSSLERVAMAPVLPRNRKMCTLQPILLKLRKDEQFNYDAPFIKLTIPGDETGKEGITCEEAREILENHMKSVGEKEDGIIVDEEIKIEVRSNGVPTIDLVDLPGLVAAKSGSHNAKLPKLTEECTLNYLKGEDTGVVVCVMDASNDNMRTSNTIKMLQQAPESLRRNAIGIFAKADKAEDLHWEDEEDENGDMRKGPLWRLEERILGTHEDYEESSEPFLGVHRGFIALVNRSTTHRTKKNQNLYDHNQEELEWIETHFKSRSDGSEAVDPRLLCNLGLDSLVLRIDSVISEHLGREWVPKKLEETAEKRQELFLLCKQLGTAPKDLTLDSLRVAAEAKLESIVPLKAIEICHDEIEAVLPHPVANDGTDYDRVVKTCQFRGLVFDLLHDGSVFERIKEKLRISLRNRFDEVQEGDDVKLERFESLGDAFEMGLLQIVDEQQESFVIASNESSNHFFLSCHEIAERYLERDRLKHALVRRALETLVLPLVGSERSEGQQPYVAKAMAIQKEMPKEKHAAERQGYENRIEQLRKIEECYRKIATPETNLC